MYTNPSPHTILSIRCQRRLFLISIHGVLRDSFAVLSTPNFVYHLKILGCISSYTYTGIPNFDFSVLVFIDLCSRTQECLSTKYITILLGTEFALLQYLRTISDFCNHMWRRTVVKETGAIWERKDWLSNWEPRDHSKKFNLSFVWYRFKFYRSLKHVNFWPDIAREPKVNYRLRKWFCFLFLLFSNFQIPSRIRIWYRKSTASLKVIIFFWFQQAQVNAKKMASTSLGNLVFLRVRTTRTTTQAPRSVDG